MIIYQAFSSKLKRRLHNKLSEKCVCTVRNKIMHIINESQNQTFSKLNICIAIFMLMQIKKIYMQTNCCHLNVK